MATKTSKITSYQRLTIGISLVGLIFGTGLYFRFCGKEIPANSSSYLSQLPLTKIPKGRIVKVVTLTVGDYHDFQWGPTRLRIRILSVSKSTFPTSRISTQEVEAASISFETDGYLVHGGEYTKKLGVNQFLLPQKWESVEEQFSVYHYITSDNYFSFFRVYVDNVNFPKNQVTLNIYFVS